MKFSANLGFLWADLSLPDAIRAAKAAGFDAVECHWPYDEPPDAVRQALADTGLSMLGINTVRGGPADFGLCALPERVAEARDAIDQAIEYAISINAGAIHLMAGKASRALAHDTFLENLTYARKSCPSSVMLLIEPLNRFDAPGYFLRDTAQAADILAELNEPGIRLMFDCYHVGRTEGDILGRFQALCPLIGHVQFASVPDRGPPDQGTVEYSELLAKLAAEGWDRPFGAEYRPPAATEDSLHWLADFR